MQASGLPPLIPLRLKSRRGLRMVKGLLCFVLNQLTCLVREKTFIGFNPVPFTLGFLFEYNSYFLFQILLLPLHV